MRALRAGLSAAVLVAAVSACGRGEPSGEGAPGEPPPTALPATPADPQPTGGEAGYRAIAVRDGGTIRGVVRLAGEPPGARVIPVVGEDTAACGPSRTVEPVILGRDAAIRGAVVSLVGLSEGAALASLDQRVVIDQTDCEFQPSVRLVRHDGVVAFTNLDPMSHNIRSTSFENRPVNTVQPRGAPPVELTFGVPERIQIRCDMHPWMAATLVVVEHPYHALTGDGGEFVLSDVPPGEHTLEVWHPALGAVTRTVTVEAGATADLELDLSAP